MTPYDIPMRWADLDSLNHVNNVVYIDYALEAWPALEAEGRLPGGRATRAVIDYHRPILKSERPIEVTSEVDESTVTQTVTAAGDDGPAATLVTTFDGDVGTARFEPDAVTRELSLRYSDIDSNGEVNLARALELLQESRVPFIHEVMPSTMIGGFVIAHLDASLHETIEWTTQPLRTQAWVQRVGGASFALTAQLCRGETVLAVATSVMVAFDPATQRSADFTEDQRTELRASMLG